MKKIAMIVSNACHPDYRVIKQAETLALQGHQVRIYCLFEKGLPILEQINGVEYYRKPFAIKELWEGFLPWNKPKRQSLADYN